MSKDTSFIKKRKIIIAVAVIAVIALALIINKARGGDNSWFIQTALDLFTEDTAQSGSNSHSDDTAQSGSNSHSEDTAQSGNNSHSDDAAQNGNDTADDEQQDSSGSSTAAEYVSYKFRNNKLLTQHYEKHGIDMGFSSKEEYEQAASDVINNPKALHKTEAEDGDLAYYVESTNEFVILSKDGYIRTYFLPDAGKKYYDRQ